MSDPSPDDVRSLLAESLYIYTQPTPPEGFDRVRAYESARHLAVLNPYSWRAYSGPVPQGGDRSVWLGGRHECLTTIVVCSLRSAASTWGLVDQHVNFDAIAAACLHWNQLRCEPPLPEVEVIQIVHEVCQAELRARTTTATLTVVH